MKDKTILVTRASSQARELTRLLQQKGARVIEAPAIQIVADQEKIAELAEALRNIDRYSWLILTSVNSVAILDEVLKSMNKDWGRLEAVQIACIGAATAAQVRRRSGRVALVPPVFQAESLVEKLNLHGMEGQHLLLPRAAGSREVLPETLRDNGAVVHEIHIYRTQQPAGSRETLQQILSRETLDFITFTSSSTVHNFFAMARHLTAKLNWEKTRAAAIGPITGATLKQYGLSDFIQAKEFTMEGLVKAIEEAVLSESTGKGPLNP